MLFDTYTGRVNNRSGCVVEGSLFANIGEGDFPINIGLAFSDKRRSQTGAFGYGWMPYIQTIITVPAGGATGTITVAEPNFGESGEQTARTFAPAGNPGIYEPSPRTGERFELAGSEWRWKRNSGQTVLRFNTTYPGTNCQQYGTCKELLTRYERYGGDAASPRVELSLAGPLRPRGTMPMAWRPT
jgi:hypothetical protein